MMPDRDEYKITELLLRLVENEVTDQEIEYLEEWLKNDPVAKYQYFDFIKDYAAIKMRMGTQLICPEERESGLHSNFDREVWAALAEFEKSAPAIEIEKPIPDMPPVRMLKIERPPRVVKKTPLYTIVAAVAALVFVLLFVQVAPPPASSVAIITDSINAQWAQSEYPTDIGSRLWDNEGSRWLQKGVVKIEFDYGAEVVIEAPAEFELESAGRMTLHSGRLCALVPSEATGFTVQTPCSTVIDLGTQFGIKVDFDGSTDIHMFKGEASLIPEQKGQQKEGVALVAGQAKAVTQTGQVREIKLAENAFVRHVDSETKLVWRGQPLSLADIVGGGNGFGTGAGDYGINVHNGQARKAVTTVGTEPSSRQYHLVSNPFIDGVFVPDGGSGEVKVTSTGLAFKDCPNTNGKTGANGNLFNGAWHNDCPGAQPHFLRLNGRTYQEPGEAIFMHSNKGITFDLDAIRKAMPGVAIKSFTSIAGISETVLEKNPGEISVADFFVLVDGDVRFSRMDVTPEDKGFDINIPLTKRDRFLTLIVTDSDGGLLDASQDWSLFVGPGLELASGSNAR